MENLQESKVRKAYAKPAIKSVSLLPKEAVLAACKIAGATFGRAGTSCTFSFPPYSSCRDLGT
ncbi:MAG: hypothetical protein JXB35_08505 [Anaerolineae bacterium]|nr:hypothetical protein [Anaerolineae bacterium]